MKIQERYLWIAIVILSLFMAYDQSSKMDNLRTLLTTYDVETNIQDDQIKDFSQHLIVSSAEEYNKGFESGRTQAAIAFMNGGNLYNYTDGYHAAISQFGLADPDYLGLSPDFLLDMLIESFDENGEVDNDYFDLITNLISNNADSNNGD